MFSFDPLDFVLPERLGEVEVVEEEDGRVLKGIAFTVPIRTEPQARG